MIIRKVWAGRTNRLVLIAISGISVLAVALSLFAVAQAQGTGSSTSATLPADQAHPVTSADAGSTSASSASQTQQMLTIPQLRKIAKQNGVEQFHKIKIEGKLAKVEGYDARHHKIKMTLNRHTGQILYRKPHQRGKSRGIPRQASVHPGSNGQLSLNQLGQIARDNGLELKEIEFKHGLVEIEGYDKMGREVELKIDRRSGTILSRKFDD